MGQCNIHPCRLGIGYAAFLSVKSHVDAIQKTMFVYNMQASLDVALYVFYNKSHKDNQTEERKRIDGT